MASGKEHHAAAKKTIVLGTVVLAGSIVVMGESMVVPALLCECGLIIGKVIDPDLDMIQITDSERRKMESKPVLGRLWLAWWAPYGALLTHRGISHWWGVGTLTRFLWIGWPILILSYLGGIVDQAFVYAIGCLLCGWVMQDTVHLHLDGYKIIFTV